MPKHQVGLLTLVPPVGSAPHMRPWPSPRLIIEKPARLIFGSGGMESKRVGLGDKIISDSPSSSLPDTSANQGGFGLWFWVCVAIWQVPETWKHGTPKNGKVLFQNYRYLENALGSRKNAAVSVWQVWFPFCHFKVGWQFRIKKWYFTEASVFSPVLMWFSFEHQWLSSLSPMQIPRLNMGVKAIK